LTNNSNEILIIGPLPPIRGGIPRHTERMAIALGKNQRVKIYTPKKLYPNWLYPGQSQYETRAKLKLGAIQVATLTKLSIIYRLLFDKKIPKNVIVVWWNIYLAPFVLLAACAIRIRGSSVFFFCHNVIPHDIGRLGQVINQVVLASGNGFAVQTEEEKEKLKRLVKSALVVNVGKPSSLQLSFSKSANKNTKSNITYLFIGLIRPYKNVPLLIDAFGNLQNESARLRIVGECWDAKLRSEIEAKAKTDERIQLNLNFVSEEEFLTEICEASFVCLPYSNASGSAVLAASLAVRTPVIVSNLPSFSHIVQHGVNGFTFESNNLTSLSSVLDEASKWTPRIEAIENTFNYTWEEFAGKLLKLIHNDT
jgi:glycosyltransferase involved in cell wall biosynthesis